MCSSFGPLHHQLHRRLARTRLHPHQPSTAALAITDEASPLAQRSTRNRLRSNAPGVRSLAPTAAEGATGVVADIAKLSMGWEEYYTRELATDHEQYLSGHGESPGRWYGAGASGLGLEGEASVAGFQAMFEGRDPTTGELLGRPHGRNAVPAFDVVLRPTKSVSILYGLADPATGRAVLQAHHAGLAEAVGYLDEHLGARRGHGGVQHVSGQGLLAVGLTIGRPEKGIRCCTPTWSWLTASKDRTAAGQPWTAATSIGTAWLRMPSTGPPTNGSCPGRSGWSGRRRTPMATGSWPGCSRTSCGGSPSAPTRSTPSSTGWPRTVGSGRRGWSSGPSRPPASPSSTRPRTPCTDAGVRRRPNATWTRTPWSGR
jgi:TrwC relaxase